MLPEQTTGKIAELNKRAHDETPQTEEIVTLIVRAMQHHAARPVARAVARIIYEAIIEHIMVQTQRRGFFRLPSGWGSFYLKVLGVGAKPRRLPSGQVVERQPKGVIRYQQGSILRQMFGTQTKAEYRRAKPRKSVVGVAVGEDVDLADSLNAPGKPSV